MNSHLLTSVFQGLKLTQNNEVNRTSDGIILDPPYRSELLVIITAVVGWIYFLAWTAAFYPQIIQNIIRHSVVGLNFDFIALNFAGQFTYAIFNVGLFWIPQLQDEYFSKYPGKVIPVQLNDVLFSLNAVSAVCIWIIQTVMFEKGDQTVSIACILLVLALIAYLFICFVLTILNAFTWLSFIYYVSYVKLLTAAVKYSPQIYLNYKRKSTGGFSTGGVLLDLIGGTLSIVQMFLIAYNYNDVTAIIGNPTKLGLGLFACLCNVIFLIQTFALYRNGYENIKSSTSE